MNKTPKISVIIPVYNCEKYLRMCLDSIIFQTYKNLEIICIDDGSKDRSLEILKEYEQNDVRFKVISQTNQGQSIARNNGIEMSNGEYISFIDADDWVSLTLYKTFIKTIQTLNRDIDIFLFNAISYSEKAKEINPKCFFDTKVWKNHTSNYCLHTFDDCMSPFSGNMSAVNKIYRTEFIKSKNLTFPENLKFEDSYFHLLTLIEAESVIINDECFYKYRNSNPTSTTASLGKNVFDIFKIIDLIEELIIDSGEYEDLKYAFLQYKYRTFKNLFLKADFFYKSKFFSEMKKRLLKTKEEDLSIEICSRLTDYSNFTKITTSNWISYLMNCALFG